jgi:hypothetical protein
MLAGATGLVPILVPKPGSPTVTQGNLPGGEIYANRALGLPRVMLDCEICSLKIRVSCTERQFTNRLERRYSMLGSSRAPVIE